MSQLTPNRLTAAETADSRWHWLCRVGAAAALILGILFLAAAVSLVISLLLPGSTNGWLAHIENNWLIVILKINASFSGVDAGSLSLNLLDVVLMVLVCTMYLGLYAALRKTSRIGAIIAAVLPFIGLALFFVTKMAGRSGVLGAGLVISLVMLWSNRFSKATAGMGILASVLLLAGDIGTSFAASIVLAICMAIGYVLMMTWLFVVSRQLFL